MAQNSKIEECVVDGYLSGNKRLGGLIGISSNCRIYRISIKAHIQGDEDIGGLIGFDSVSNISQISNRSKILGKSNIGGLIGYNNSSLVKDVENYINIKGQTNIGNILGKSKKASIENAIIVSDNLSNNIGLDMNSKLNQIYINKNIQSVKNFDIKTWHIINNHIPHLIFDIKDKSFAAISNEDIPIYMDIFKELPDDIIESDFINVNLKNNENRTPIYYCKNVHQLEHLIKRGADIFYKDKYKESPMHKYCKEGNVEIVKILLENGGKY